MFRNQKILILGMARSGISVAKFLTKYNNDITITDLKEQDEKILGELKKLNIKVVITDKQEDLIDETFDLVVKNPAIISTSPAVEKARNLHIPVINELEVCYHFLPEGVKIVGITGSNGKTTTTTLIYELLKKTYDNVYLGGNIGIPLASLVETIKPNSILVLEVSDHQLCDVCDFKTDISVLTNISQVHLDFHGNSFEKYKSIKKRIFNHHTEDNLVILNKDDENVLKLSKDIPSKKLYFSKNINSDIYLNNNSIIYQGKTLIETNDISLKGVHNYENIMAAILVVKQFNVSDEIIKDFLANFKGIEHRIEYVRTLNDRKFYNDSKATNNQSTITALKSFNEKIILLMGGLDRNIPFDELAPYLNNVKTIICFGETKEKIADFAQSNNKECYIFDELKAATEKAYEISEKGDVILLSPACASWDQYPDFETRGTYFKEIVNNLK